MRFEWLSFAIVKNNLPDLLYAKKQVAKVVKREDQLVCGSSKVLLLQKRTQLCHTREELFQEADWDMMTSLKFYSLSSKSRPKFKLNATYAWKFPLPSFFCLLVSQFSLTWPSPLWLIPQVSSVLWRTAVEFAPHLYPFSLLVTCFLSLSASLRCVCLSSAKVKFEFNVDGFK